jgi:hypothetical protein
MPFTKLIITVVLMAIAMCSQAQQIGTPFEFSDTLKPGDNYMSIQLQGALRLSTNKVNGLSARELSGLAWDEDEQLLYAVSDDGYLIHLIPEFTDGVLTGLEFINAYPLRDSEKNILKSDDADGESLTIINGDNNNTGDSILIISLEAPQRIQKFKTNGAFISEIPLPQALYYGQELNDDAPTLNALSSHPELELLMAPVKALTDTPDGLFSIFSSKGKKWNYPPLDKKNSATLGMETLPDGNVLVIERVYSSIFKPVIYALRKLEFDGEAIKIKEIAHFNNREGWSIDNFESVTRYKENSYFMISDDNESSFQKTLLIYFKLIEDSTSKSDTEP